MALRDDLPTSSVPHEQDLHATSDQILEKAAKMDPEADLSRCPRELYKHDTWSVSYDVTARIALCGRRDPLKDYLRKYRLSAGVDALLAPGQHPRHQVATVLFRVLGCLSTAAFSHADLSAPFLSFFSGTFCETCSTHAVRQRAEKDWEWVFMWRVVSA